MMKTRMLTTRNTPGICAFLLVFIASACVPGGTKLFDGKTLRGWECDPSELVSHWTVKKGNILLGENPDQKGSMLWTTREYTDYELELEYQTLTDDYDTGVFPRGDGHQVQIGISRSLQRDMTACIYAPKDEKGAYPGQTDKVAEFHRVGEWNHLKIIVTGKRLQTILNGEPFVDYEGITINEKGPIGLQLHAGVHMAVQFKNIRITEL
jgi:hypothetical protein